MSKRKADPIGEAEQIFLEGYRCVRMTGSRSGIQMWRPEGLFGATFYFIDESGTCNCPSVRTCKHLRNYRRLLELTARERPRG